MRAYAEPICCPITSCAPQSLQIPPGGESISRTIPPAVIHMELVPGSKVDIHVAAKGGGSEAKSKLVMLNPADSIVDWVVKTVPTMGAGWCPPGMLGIGIGGTAEKAMLLAKRSLMDPIDIYDLQARGPSSRVEELRLEIFEKVNALGIGAQGLGGLTTVLDVKILDFPTPCGQPARRHDTQLCGHPACPFCPGRQWQCRPAATKTGRLA